MQLAIFATTIKIRNKVITLTTIKDIQHVLEEQETEAWQKLIRVLTHEIMNSITPIASLTSTVENMLKGIRNTTTEHTGYETDGLPEIENALQTINKRSRGLLHFVDTYRSLTQIQKPNFTFIKVVTLFNSIKSLFEDELINSNIRLIIRIEPQQMEITAMSN